MAKFLHTCTLFEEGSDVIADMLPNGLPSKTTYHDLSVDRVPAVRRVAMCKCEKEFQEDYGKAVNIVSRR